MSKTKATEISRDEEEGVQLSAVDPLLGCLVFLTTHYGRAKSAEALTAGLAYDERNMRPTLFCEAAGRLGLKTQIKKKASISEIKEALYPVVLILENEQACVVLKRDQDTLTVFDPTKKEIKEAPLSDIETQYEGFAIYVRPRSAFANLLHMNADEVKGHWFWSIVEDNRPTYIMVLIGAVFINLFGLTSPLFIMNVYDRVIPNNAIETGWALGIGALVIFGFDLLMRLLRAYLIDVAGRRIDVMAGRRIYDQVLNMRIAGRPASSGVFANMLKDFDSVRDFFTSATVTVLADLPFTLFFLFIIYQVGGGIAFMLLGLIVLTFAIGMVLQAPLKALVRKSVHSAEAKHGLLIETIHGLETVKAIGADGQFRARYSDYLGENAAYGQGSRFISSLGIFTATFLQQIASILIVLAGMYMVRDAELSMGALIACVILGGRAIAPIGQIANLMTRYHHANSALKTLEDIMGKAVERPADKQFLHRPDLSGKIAFKNVGFAYPGVQRKVLDRVSFSIEPGEKVGIIGRIGSGKSTVARLMLNLYEPDEGTILADDTDYRQIDPADLRRNVAYIAQDVVLFTGSVRDNIALSKPHATEEEILRVAKVAGVHDFVSKHPMGYDAPVGEHGNALSGGQRQAVAFARAMLIEPNIIVCDEPTNAMDQDAERAFRSYVEKEAKNKTIILITHKHTLLPMVDRLILMDQGRVVLDGPREKVIEALKAGKVRAPK